MLLSYFTYNSYCDYLRAIIFCLFFQIRMRVYNNILFSINIISLAKMKSDQMLVKSSGLSDVCNNDVPMDCVKFV